MNPAAAAARLEDLADRALRSEFEPVTCLEAPEPAEVPRSLRREPEELQRQAQETRAAVPRAHRPDGQPDLDLPGSPRRRQRGHRRPPRQPRRPARAPPGSAPWPASDSPAWTPTPKTPSSSPAGNPPPPARPPPPSGRLIRHCPPPAPPPGTASATSSTGGSSPGCASTPARPRSCRAPCSSSPASTPPADRRP